MQVDYVLILAAGKGTRMGEIGKKLPKILWPIFEKSLLELEVEYARKFKPQRIFVNLFHQKEFLEKEILQKKIKNIEIVNEDTVLDIGGAIHNIASKVNYSGTLLIINCDQFIMLDDNITKKFDDLSKDSDVCLLSYTVSKSDGYNALEVQGESFIKITPNSIVKEDNCDTYTGMSTVKLASLEKIPGRSKFFETVANPENRTVNVLNINASKYWDFGTSRRYYESMFSIIDILNSGENDTFIDFLKSSDAIDMNKLVAGGGYAAPKNIIDLGENENLIENTIYLEKANETASKAHSIIKASDEDLILGLD